MSERLNNGLMYVFVMAILIVIYIILLIITNMIPSSLLEKNIKESAETLLKQGEIREIDLGYKTEKIFNFSDALMLNMAYSVDCKKPFQAMLLSRKDYIKGITEKENTKATENIGADSRFINPNNGDVDHTDELYHFINYKDFKESFEYARYWHGYMIFLRPLLMLFNISQIRTLFTGVLIVLSIALAILIYKKLNLITSIVFLIGLFSCSVFMVGQSISEIPVFMVALITSIIILLKKDANNKIGLIFLIAGSIVGFTDLLTEPLIAVLFPLTVYYLVAQKEEKMSFWEVIKKYSFLCIIWIIGYVVTWGSKWIILDMIYNRGILKQAFEQISIRSTTSKKTLYDVLIRVEENIPIPVIAVLTILPILSMSFYSVIRIFKGVRLEISKMNIIPFLINIFVPFIWYFVIKNHSYIHPFFSYKLIMLSIINLLILISYILGLYRVKQKQQLN